MNDVYFKQKHQSSYGHMQFSCWMITDRKYDIITGSYINYHSPLTYYTSGVCVWSLKWNRMTSFCGLFWEKVRYQGGLCMMMTWGSITAYYIFLYSSIIPSFYSCRGCYYGWLLPTAVYIGNHLELEWYIKSWGFLLYPPTRYNV